MNTSENKSKAHVKKKPRNRTISLSKNEVEQLSKELLKITSRVNSEAIENKIIKSDFFKVEQFLPNAFIDLLFVDPPYNLTKNFNSKIFNKMSAENYENWLDSWLKKLDRMLKPNASIYICGDWQSSSAIFNAARRYFIPQTRITWEREKGRGAKANWKNCSEDIWFFTKSNKFIFNIDAVKIKRKVMAPYRTSDGLPKDWNEHQEGNYRLTHPSNLWTDITIPFWSMAENTTHPTQKPEKLLAKLILASSNKGDLVFDPFIGSGTAAVTAKKLDRKYCGIEIDNYYCCLAQKRLNEAEADKNIQGYHNGIFWERNSLKEQNSTKEKKSIKFVSLKSRS
jgi:site-specific DNA-methyltransferase (adenine-specific)